MVNKDAFKAGSDKVKEVAQNRVAVNVKDRLIAMGANFKKENMA